MTFVTKWAPCNVIYAQQNKHKKSPKKSKNTKVAMLTWSTNDVFLSVFQCTNMQMLRRYLMLHPIIPCHSLVAYIIVAMSSPAQSRSPMREKACWLVNSFIPDSAELIVAVLWRSRCLEHVAKLVKWSNWSCNASQLTFWSCKNYWSMVIHLFSHFTCRTTHWDLKR